MSLTTWIVLADSARADIYASDAGLLRGPDLIEAMHHPASRVPSHELGSDDRGRTRAAPGMGASTRSGVDFTYDKHDREAELFSHELAQRLDAAGLRGDYEHLILVAPPHFLGLLRKDIDSGTSQRVSASLDRSLTHLAAHQVLDEVRQRLA